MRIYLNDTEHIDIRERRKEPLPESIRLERTKRKLRKEAKRLQVEDQNSKSIDQSLIVEARKQSHRRKALSRKAKR